MEQAVCLEVRMRLQTNTHTISAHPTTRVVILGKHDNANCDVLHRKSTDIES